MVLGSQPRRAAMYWTPPWPSLAASMAAYRRRSFSESESWNNRIECSISGEYVMGGCPWRRRGGPRQGYTIRTKDREVVELAFLSWPRGVACPARFSIAGQLFPPDDGRVHVGGPDSHRARALPSERWTTHPRRPAATP